MSEKSINILEINQSNLNKIHRISQTEEGL
jgi:hypothetical protein